MLLTRILTGKNMVLYILLLAFISRLAVVLSIDPFGSDTIDGFDYHNHALALLNGEGYPARGSLPFMRPPLYPMLLSAVYYFFPHDGYLTARLVNVFLDVATCFVFYKLIILIWENRKVAFLSSLVYAVNPLFIFFSARVRVEALMGGIEAANGKYIIMGDADDSYDWLDIPKFVAKLDDGFDLVQGCRLPSGGGRVLPGAMPFLHRWWGNPMFSFLARLWFKTPVHDVHCGMRAFTEPFYKRLELRCTGMEFATEMLINASFLDCKIDEIPITLYPDGRIGKAPHLKTFRDGWRHLRHYLMYSPRWLFLFPGTMLMLLGFAGFLIGLPGVTITGIGALGSITFSFT